MLAILGLLRAVLPPRLGNSLVSNKKRVSKHTSKQLQLHAFWAVVAFVVGVWHVWSVLRFAVCVWSYAIPMRNLGKREACTAE